MDVGVRDEDEVRGRAGDLEEAGNRDVVFEHEAVEGRAVAMEVVKPAERDALILDGVFLEEAEF